MILMKTCFCALIVLATICANASADIDSVPPLINYQGILTDAEGLPIPNEVKKLEFNIYDAAVEGAKIWGPQIFNAVPIINGQFNVILGTTDSNGRSISKAFDSASRYLGIKVGDTGLEITPRQQILSTPYAMHARKASNACSIQDNMVDLIIENNRDNLHSQLELSAKKLTVEDYCLSNIGIPSPIIFDIRTNGLNGLDEGNEGENLWYLIWVIYNPTTDDVGGLFSLDDDSPPILPDGFSAKRLVGAVRNDGPNLIEFKQVNKRVAIDIRTSLFVSSGSPTGEWRDLSSVIPKMAKEICGMARSTDTYIGLASEPYKSQTTSSYRGLGYIYPGGTGGWDNAPFCIIITEPQMIYNSLHYGSSTVNVTFVISSWEY